MAEVKTKPTNKSTLAFIKAIPEPEKRKDSLVLLKIFKDVTEQKPRMWGAAIVGFGMYHYKSERSAQEGDWPLTAFSPRKQGLTLYVMPGFKDSKPLLKKLGKHTTSVAGLYIKRLSDVDMKVLTKIIKQSFVDSKKKYGDKGSKK
jgi:hypothetical protein